jgi:hypothetical protein
MPDFHPLLGKAVRKGLRTTGTLLKAMLPAYLVMDLLQRTPVLPAIGRALGPLMSPLGLPGEAALGIVLGCLVNLYAAVGALKPLGLSPGQVTLCGLVLGIAHTLVVETSVLKAIRTRYLLLAAYRLALAILVGLAAAPFFT